MYVGETKYLSDPETYGSAIDASDSDTLEILLTRPAVEQRILKRVEEKVMVLQADLPIFQSPLSPMEWTSRTFLRR